MKRNLILTLITCGATLALCPSLRADDATPAPSAAGEHQGGHHGPAGGADMMEHLTKELTLTADQQTKIKPILDALHTQIQTIRQDTTLTRKDQMPKVKEARDAANAQINGILTPDQQAKYAAMQQKMHEHRHEAAEANPSASPVKTP